MTGALLVVIAAAAATGGFALQRRTARHLATTIAWLLAGATFVAVVAVTDRSPPFLRMLALVGAILLGMKAVVASLARTPLAPLRWAAFCLWPGMNPRTFAHRARRTGVAGAARDGLVCLGAGIGLLALARTTPLGRYGSELAVFAGCSLAVHFGLFALHVALLRACGFPAARLFRAPWRARTLAEFWSQRWNLGFVEMTALAVHRPLRPRVGAAGATLLAFALSGLLHECAITVPVRAGYGGPLAYFALQGAAVLLEQRLRLRGVAWTFACLLLPLPWLFPAPFRAMVVDTLLG